MRYGILGHLELHDGDDSVSIAQGHQRLLLAVLLVHANEAVSNERLVDALWSDPPPPTAVRSLHNLISALRKVLGESRLVTEAYGYRLRVGNYRVFFDFDGAVRIVSIEEVRKRDEQTY